MLSVCALQDLEFMWIQPDDPKANFEDLAEYHEAYRPFLREEIKAHVEKELEELEGVLSSGRSDRERKPWVAGVIRGSRQNSQHGSVFVQFRLPSFKLHDLVVMTDVPVRLVRAGGGGLATNALNSPVKVFHHCIFSLLITRIATSGNQYPVSAPSSPPICPKNKELCSRTRVDMCTLPRCVCHLFPLKCRSLVTTYRSSPWASLFENTWPCPKSRDHRFWMQY